MSIYYIMLFLWAFGAAVINIKGESLNNYYQKKYYAIYAGVILTLVMGLKKYTVGCDWEQYLYVYRELIPTMSWDDIFDSNRGGFYSLNVLMHTLGVDAQGYIFIIAVILSAGFSFFFFIYSDNLFLSLYLHVTIGLFTISMSGIRQSLAVVLVLMSYCCLKKKRYVLSLFLVLLAVTFHSSAMAFLITYVVYFFCNGRQFRFKTCLLLWILTTSSLLYRKALVPIIALLTPNEYTERIDLLSDSYPINPLLIVIALMIPLACLLCRQYLGESEYSINQEIFSEFYVFSCIYAFCSIMSLNSNLLGRVGYYFQCFSVILIANTVSSVPQIRNRVITYIAAFILPMIQFMMATPGGTLRIDNYLFFWQ